MPHPGPQVARGHLRLASSPSGHRGPEKRILLLLRAILVATAVVVRTTAAWFAAAIALMPLVWRRAPLGRRLRPHPPREARVIPFQPRRQALPR